MIIYLLSCLKVCIYKMNSKAEKMDLKRNSIILEMSVELIQILV